MKGLIKFLSPFAPDQSGASGVLYGLGGLIVICDAGGCTGNICGFDEPRWFLRSSGNALPENGTPGVILSAGLRDMDAILGRDDQLIEKLKDAAQKLGSPFAALIGTPVPAVIGTDFPALRRMAERRCHLPVLGIPCTGTGLYDEGEEAAYLALFERFASVPSWKSSEKAAASEGTAVFHNPVPETNRTSFSKFSEEISPNAADSLSENKPASRPADPLEKTVPGRLGILGATPLNLSTAKPFERLSEALGTDDLLCYGAAGGLKAVALAPTAEKNIVLSPSGLAAAKKLQMLFGTPYEVRYPLLARAFPEAPPAAPAETKTFSGKRALVVHQQVLANEARRRLLSAGCASVTVATFFKLEKELAAPGDLHLSEENDLRELLESGEYDLVAADRYLARCAKDYAGDWVHLPHFAVSGECADLE